MNESSTNAKHKRIEDAIIIKKETFDNRHVYFECQLKSSPSILPGQFIEVLVENNPSVFLRRPLSVHDWDEQNQILSLWIKIVGEGTQTLSQLQVNDSLNVVYPLGNGFSMPKSSKVLLVGGGCGAAPLLYLARYLHGRGIIPDILLGARSCNELIFPEKYSKYGNVEFMTEDGSLGDIGLVTKHPNIAQHLSTYSKIYACGPNPMMKAIGKLAIQQFVDCEVSLENLMACGIGACLCCIVQSDYGNVCTCTEGPVFNVTSIQNWIQK